MKKILVTMFAMVFVATLAGCGAGVDKSTHEETKSSTTQIDETEDDYGSDEDSSGIGMTYNGKVGIDLGGGLIMPIGGGGASYGVGF